MLEALLVLLLIALFGWLLIAALGVVFSVLGWLICAAFSLVGGLLLMLLAVPLLLVALVLGWALRPRRIGAT